MRATRQVGKQDGKKRLPQFRGVSQEHDNPLQKTVMQREGLEQRNIRAKTNDVQFSRGITAGA